jgi:cytochrome c
MYVRRARDTFLRISIMDSFEFSKIAGAVLLAALAIVLPKTLMDMRVESAAHGGRHEVAGYVLPAAAAKPADGKSGASAQVAAATPGAATDAGLFDKVKPLLAAAKPDAGSATFKACAACHSGDKGGANKVGPALWGVVGRKTGAHEGFNYSEPMKAKGGDWTYDRLAAFLNNPKGYIPGTKMVYNGVQEPEKLADLLAYLGSLSDSPVPLPK